MSTSDPADATTSAQAGATPTQIAPSPAQAEATPTQIASAPAQAGAPAPFDGLPDPSTRPCADCGHVWFDGERRHEYLIGPPPPGFRKGRVEVVCVLCGRQRHRQAAGD